MTLQIIPDSDPSRGWTALCEESELIELYGSETPRPGAVMVVRIQSVFPSARLAHATGPEGLELSIRLTRPQNRPDSKMKAGDLCVVTITSQRRADKPVHAVPGVELLGRYVLLKPQPNDTDVHVTWSQKMAKNTDHSSLVPVVDMLDSCAKTETIDIILRRSAVTDLAKVPDEMATRLMTEIKGLLRHMHQHSTILSSRTHFKDMHFSEPCLLYAGMSAVDRLSLYHPDAQLVRAEDANWDDILDKALKYSQIGLETKRGSVIWCETTRAGIMIDCDSGRSGLSGEALAADLIPEIIKLIRLRCLSGRIIIDFPYLSKPSQQKIDAQLRLNTQQDPRSIDMLGFTRSGLYELVIRHTYRPLDEWLDL